MPASMHHDDIYPNQVLQTRNDLYEGMKPLVIFGRLVCIIPWGQSSHSVGWKKSLMGLGLIPVLITLFIIGLLFYTNYSFAKDLVQRAPPRRQLVVVRYYMGAHPSLAATIEVFIFTYFLLNSSRFYRIFERWQQVSRRIPLERDKWLRPLSFLLIGYSIFEALFHAYLLYDISVSYRGKWKIPWIRMFHNIFGWKLPYKPVYAVLIFILRVETHIASVIVAPLTIFFSRVMAFQFKKLIVEAAGTGVSEAHFADLRRKDKLFWRNIVERHKALSLLAKTINNFLSPLLFWWTAFNIYLLSATLHRALFGVAANMSKNMFLGSFAIETFQFLVTIICATKVNTYAVKILNILRNCPKDHYYDTEICRLEHFVTTGPTIGFTGLGCFALTRPFLISIFNAVFTVEIILLQSSESAKAK